MLPYPNATLRGPRGMLVIVPAGTAAADLRRFQVFAPHGRAPAAGQQAADLLLQNAAQDSAAVQAIRNLYINQWGTIDGLSPDQLVARLRRDLTDGNFVAAFYIPAPDTVQYVVTTKAETSSLLQDPAGDPLKWSPAQRIAAMLRRIPAHLPGALQAQVTALFTPQAIALTALMLAALAVAQAYGVGEIVDLILVAAAWAAAGWAGLVALKDFIAAIIDAAGQTTLAPIEADAAQAADALVVLGITFITAVLLRAQDQEKVVSLEKPPPEEPVMLKKPAPVLKGWKDYAAAKGADTSKAVFRGDSRPPSTVFEQGFQPKGTSTDLLDYAKNNTASTFVSTSKDESVATQFAQDAAQDRGSGYMYVVSPSAEGIDVNQALGNASPYKYENEIAFPGGVPGSDIVGAQQIGPDGTTIGPFIPNPGFSGP